MRVDIGILGGSGIENVKLFKVTKQIERTTPYGNPSGPIEIISLKDSKIALLLRHGKGHKIPAHKVNHLANIWALKGVGAGRIISTSSVGSLKRKIKPRSVIVPHDYISFWNIPSYFNERVVHITPSLDNGLRKKIISSARKLKLNVIERGIYVQTSGPRLETKAEIAFFKDYGEVLGMTMASEATLAKELGIKYACICTVDNYCHGIIEEPLTYEQIKRNQKRNESILKELLSKVIEELL